MDGSRPGEMGEGLKNFHRQLELIIQKYGSMPDFMSDEIDMNTNTIVVDNGHLRGMKRQDNWKEFAQLDVPRPRMAYKLQHSNAYRVDDEHLRHGSRPVKKVKSHRDQPFIELQEHMVPECDVVEVRSDNRQRYVSISDEGVPIRVDRDSFRESTDSGGVPLTEAAGLLSERELSPGCDSVEYMDEGSDEEDLNFFMITKLPALAYKSWHSYNHKGVFLNQVRRSWRKTSLVQRKTLSSKAFS